MAVVALRRCPHQRGSGGRRRCARDVDAAGRPPTRRSGVGGHRGGGRASSTGRGSRSRVDVRSARRHRPSTCAAVPRALGRAAAVGAGVDRAQRAPAALLRADPTPAVEARPRRSRSCSPTSRASPSSPPSTATRRRVALLAEHHRVIGPIVRSRGGKVVKRLGDGLMLSFPSPEAAVLAAIELLERGAGAAAPAGRRAHRRGRRHPRRRDRPRRERGRPGHRDGQGRAGAGVGRRARRGRRPARRAVRSRSAGRSFKGVETDERVSRRAAHETAAQLRRADCWRPSRSSGSGCLQTTARRCTATCSPRWSADVDGRRARAPRLLEPWTEAPFGSTPRAAVPRWRCTGSCSRGRRPSSPRTTPRWAGVPGRAVGRAFLRRSVARPRRDLARLMPTACRPTRSVGRRRWSGGYCHGRGAAACRCGSSRSEPAPGSTCGGTTTATRRPARRSATGRQPGALRRGRGRASRRSSTDRFEVAERAAATRADRPDHARRAA